MSNKVRVKCWPLKDNRTVELEIVVDSVTLSVELDLDQADEVHEDLGDAIRLVKEDWI